MQGGSSTASSAAAAAAAAMFQGMRPPQFPEPEQQQLKCPRCESTNTKFCYYNNYNLSQPRHFCKSCRRYWTKGGSLRNIPVGGGTRKNSTKRSKSGTSGEDSDCNNNKDNGNATATAATKTDGNPAKRANNNTTTTNNHHPHHTNSASSSLTNPIPTQTAPAPAALTSADPPSSLPKPELLPPIYPSGEQEPRMFEIGGSFSSLLSSAPHFANLMSIPSLSGHHPLDLGTVSSTPHFGGCDDVTPAAPAPPAEEDFLNLQGDPGCWSTGDRSASGGGRSGGWPGLSIYPPDSDFH